MHDGLSDKELRDYLGEKSRKLSFLLNLTSSELSERIKESKKRAEAIETYMCLDHMRDYIKFLKDHAGVRISELENKLKDFEKEWGDDSIRFTLVSGQKEIEKLQESIKECEDALCVSKILTLMGWATWHAPEYTSIYCDFYNGVPVIDFIGTKEEFISKHKIEPRSVNHFKPDNNEKV